MAKPEEEKRRPWMKFYPADWQADEGLGQCSLAARGLWIELIAMMHKSSPFGHLLIAGKVPTPAQVAVQVKSDVKTVTKALGELEQWGVFSRTEEGVIFSRRMIADEKKEQTDRANGKGGGNPNLTKKQQMGVNPPDNGEVGNKDNPPDNGVDKAQKLEARSQSKVVALGTDGETRDPAGLPPSDPFPRYQNPPGNPPMPPRGSPPEAWLHLGPPELDDRTGITHAVVGDSYIDLAADAVCQAAKIREERWRGDWRPLIEWLRDGINFHQTILPAVQSVASRPGYKPPGSLRYFDNAVRQLHAEMAA